MRTGVVVLLLILVTLFFFHKQIRAKFDEVVVIGKEKAIEKVKSAIRVDGYNLKYTGEVVLQQVVTADTLSFDLSNGTLNLQGNDATETDLIIKYYEYEPQDASISLVGEELISTTKSGKPVLITSIEGSIPRQLSLKFETANGKIQMNGMNGSKQISLDTGNGNIALVDCVATSVTMDTGNGSISMDNCQIASANADTGNGSISVNNSTVDYLKADTGLGNITLSNSKVKKRELGTGLGKVIEQ